MIFWTLFIIIVTILFATHGKKIYRNGNIFAKIGFILIVVISIFRFDVGYDYHSYYKTLIPQLHTISLERMEPLNHLIYYITDYIGWPPLLFIIYGLITYSLVFYALKNYSDNYFIAVITYMAFFYLASLDTIRQALAIAIIIYAYKYLINNNLMYYIFCVIIAYLFHKSAIICIIYPLIYRYFNFKIFIISIITIFIIYQSVSIILTKYLGFESYLEIGDTFKGGALTRYVFLILNILLLWLTRNKHDVIIRKILYITTIGSLLPFLVGAHLGSRMSWFFLSYICFVIPHVVNKFKMPIRLLSSIILCLYFIIFIYVSTSNTTKTPLTPYRTIFTIDVMHPQFK